MSRTISALLILFVLLTGVFYLRPLKDTLAKLDQSQSAKADEVAELSEQYQKLKLISETLPQSETEKKKVLRSIPETLSQDLLIKNIKKLAEDNEIFFSSLSFNLVKTSELDEGLSEINISATFKGTYEDLIKFTEAVEKNSRKIVIKSISVQLEPEQETEENKEQASKEETTTTDQKKNPDQKPTELYASFSLNMSAYFQGKME